MTLGGGMAVQAQVADDWQRITGATLIQAYGLTETSPGACINPMNAARFNGSAGLPLPSTEVIIRNPDGDELPLGEDGELAIRGPQVMRGYWHREQETRQVLDDDGWLRTGDIAHLDADGYVYLVDRKKDIILVSGFNVYPNEVEDTASRHPGVREVAAVSVPDPKSGEAVKLFVVREDPTLAPEALIAFCRESLARYKVPRFIEFRDELPKTNVGKILRRKLRETGNDGDKG
jgi:long-chain acyl-CoA synthetase